MALLKPLMALASVLALVSAPAEAENWAQWRGPCFNGSSPTEKGLPASWSLTDGVLWAAPMPGPSFATPAVWGDRVFVSSTDRETGDLVALGLSAADGKVLWRHKLGADRKAPRNNMATPSPVTDGRRAFFLYGTGDLAAIDAAGKVLWTRNLEKEYGNVGLKYGYSCSPLLYGGKLYVAFLRRTEPYYPPMEKTHPMDSYLLAVNPDTGKNLFRSVRPTDAIDESFEAYASPLPLEHAGRAQILLNGGDYVTGHDPTTGRELWRWGYNPSHKNLQRLIPSVTPGTGLIYFTAPRGQTLYALKAGARGLAKDAAIVAWTFGGPTTDSATPLLYQGLLYVLESDRKVLTALEAATGRQVWQEKLGQGPPWRASPTGADGKVYLINEDGQTLVLEAGNAFKVLSRTEMGGGPICSSIAVSGGRLYLRTATHLYCIGK